MDKPKKYGFEREPVPYSFGFVLFLIFLIGVSLYISFSQEVLSVVVAAAGIVLMGLLDDRFGLSPVFRFVWQFVCAGLVVFGGAEILEVAVPFVDQTIVLGGLGVLVSVVWIVFLTNALNFLDGVSGLTSAVSFNAFLGLVGLALLPGVHTVSQDLVVGFGSLMMVVSLLGMVLEFDKPKVLIGDSGTMFFGFMLAVLSMLNGGKLATLGLVLIVPILDGVGVIVMRVLNKRKPWEGDFNHLHHLFLRAGLSRRMIVVMYGLISFVLAMVAIFYWNSVVKFLALGGCVIGLVFVILYNHKKYADWENFDKLKSS